MLKDEMRQILMRRYSDGGAQAAEEISKAGESKTESGNENTASQEETAKKAEKTYTRDEVNKIVNAERIKAANDAVSAMKNQETEAAKLAKMSTEDRLNYEKEQAIKQAQDAQAELNAYKLKDEAVKLAGKENLPVELLDLLDFKAMSAETVSDQIKSMSKLFQASVQQEVNSRLKQASPETHVQGNARTDYSELLRQAQENNDMTAIAYYTRLANSQK